ncbi:Cell division protein FtsB [Paracoccus solventivorans]|uniref:Cell division protein FtsB n=2 Tax=Paracoccus solventivorans TaxID=53463 RepID=A0A1M7G254_9RHOB|nr:Cell division protein FtsB [Paracoccus solventivorans]
MSGSAAGFRRGPAGARRGQFPLPVRRGRMAENGPENMNRTLPIGALVYVLLALLLSLYFAFAAVQGPSGILRRVQLEAETAQLVAERDALAAEVARMKSLTRRLSDEYLDLELLDERARDVLGLVRGDELIVR